VTTVILRTVTKFVVPIIVVLSIALFLQGHNQPGGGFIAGVLTTSAFALIYVTYGLDFLEEDVLGRDVESTIEHLSHGVVSDYRHIYAIGLAIAAGSGLVVMVIGISFLSQNYVILEHVPIYGEIELASAVIFDLGVYAVVVGSLLTVLSVVGAE
jgi:multicomponent Na+:H+ antiporter subunit B